MGKPIARIGDMHICPLATPNPHVGGPILGPGCPTVLVGGQPVAVVGDTATCSGPPDVIVTGSIGVFIGGKPVARMGDMTAHGGQIVAGVPTVLIGEIGTSMGLIPSCISALSGSVNPTFPPTPSAQGAFSGVAVLHHEGVQHPITASAIFVREEQANTESQDAWFQAKVVYSDGQACIGIRYNLTTSDGSQRQGKSDTQGMLKVGGISPGECQLSFLDLEQDSWEVG